MTDHVHVRKGAVPSDGFRNPVLENISIAAFQDPGDFVARQVFPTVPVDDQAFKYYEFDMNTIGQNKAQARAPGTPAEEGAWNLTTKPGLCAQYGYREKLPEELLASWGPAANAEEASALSVTEVLNISEEVRFGALYTTGIWDHDMVGQATADATHYVFWNRATSSPINDVAVERKRVKLSGKRWPNTLVLGADVLPALLTNPQIVARVINGTRPGASAADVQLSDLAQLFKVDRVLLAGAVYNSANENATPTPAFILNSKSAWLGYVNPNPGVRMPSAGYRFAWQAIAGNAMGIRNWRYWEQSVRSYWVEGAVDDVFLKVGAQMGMFFSAIVE